MAFAYSNFWLQGEKHIREGGLIETGLNRAITIPLKMQCKLIPLEQHQLTQYFSHHF